METQIDEVKKKIDIVEFIGSLITVKKAGRNFKAVCPFHNEKTPSFVISPDRQIWHCFGACQDGGDVIKFLMKWENITFAEALQQLAEKAGVKLKKFEFEDKSWQKKEKLLKINSLATSYFEYILHKTKLGEKGRDYLKNRGINLKIAEKFQLGYSPNSWDSLINFLKKKSFTELEINETGLLVKNDRGRYYDRFRGRLMFPLCDSRGVVVGFSGRSLDPEEKAAKYINTPETYIYHKREMVFGLHLAKEAIRKNNLVYLVEGEFDVISPYQNGIENIVAIKGSAVTQEQLQLLKRYCQRLVFTLDSDAAGIEAMKRGINEAEFLDFDINVVTFDFAKDPDEAVRKDLAQFKKTLAKSLPIYDFIINETKKKYPEESSFAKKQIAEEVVEFIQRIHNPIVRSHYVKKTAALLDVAENSIESLIRKNFFNKNKKSSYLLKKTTKTVKIEERDVFIEKYFMSLILQDKNPYLLFNQIKEIVSAADLNVVAHGKLLEELATFQKTHLDYQMEEFVKLLPAQLRPVFDEVYLFASHFQIGDKQLEKLAYELKANSLKRQLKKILTKEDTGDEKQLKDLNESLNRVEKTLSAL